MSEAAREHHISSAVVSTLPEYCASVAARLASEDNMEVHHVKDGKIVIVLEGPSQDVIGGRLARIALLDHVLSANLVYEIVDTEAPEEEIP